MWFLRAKSNLGAVIMQVEVRTEGEALMFGVFNLSSASYQFGNCTLYGCYEDSALDLYSLPNSSCLINSQGMYVHTYATAF